jgi:antitoxin YefM
MHELLRSRFVGMHELRKSLSKLLDSLAEEDHEVIVTRQGKPAAVLLDVDRYLELQQAIREFADPDYLAALLEARRGIRAGASVAAEDVFAQKGL